MGFTMIKLKFMKIVLTYISSVSIPMKKECKELIEQINYKMEEL